MDFVVLVEKLKNRLAQRKEDISSVLLNGVKDMQEYEFLRGRINSLADVESDLNELVNKMVKIEDDKGISS